MKKTPVSGLLARFTAPLPSVDERKTAVKALRANVPHERHGGYRLADKWADPIVILEELAKTRLPKLVLIRYARMLASPFAFLRGSAAVMASLMMLTLCLVSHPAQALSLCYDGGEQYPWILKNGKGLNIVLLEMVAARTGEKLELISKPWKQCLEGVEKGDIDGAFAASYTDERAKYAVYPMAEGKLDPTRRLHTDGYTLLRLKGSGVGWDGRKFSNLTGAIGTQSSYSIAADLIRWGAEVDSNSDTPETLLKRFGAGQLQAIALLTGEARFAMSKPYLANKVEIVSPPLTEKPYFLIFGRGYYDKNRKKADDIWLMIETVRESVEYKARETADQSSQ